MENFSDILLKNLLHNRPFLDKVLPHIHPEYFESFEDSRIFLVIKKYVEKYNKIPSYSILKIYFKEKETKISEPQLKVIMDRIGLVESSSYEEATSLEWLVDSTEDWAKNRAVQQAILDSADIYSQQKKDNMHLIPGMLEKALQVCFDDSVGHDYLADSNERFDSYGSRESRYPTHLGALNYAIGGGFKRKTLCVFMGQSGIGKSRMLVDLSAHYLKQGFNVAYISCELSEDVVAQRFDANLLDISLDVIEKKDTKEKLQSKIKTLKGYVTGHLVIKEYPTSAASVIHIKSFLNELKQKKNMVPDFLVIDYLNILASAKQAANSNMYNYYKSVAEELRALAVEQNMCCLTATQTNRAGWSTTDVTMGNISESAGIVHTADFMAALIGTQELLDNGQILISILKNRLYKLGKNSKFVIGFSDDTMKHFDIDRDMITFCNEESLRKRSKKDDKEDDKQEKLNKNRPSEGFQF